MTNAELLSVASVSDTDMTLLPVQACQSSSIQNYDESLDLVYSFCASNSSLGSLIEVKIAFTKIKHFAKMLS